MEVDWYRLYRSLDKFITMLVMPGLIEDYSDDEDDYYHNSEQENDDDNDGDSNNINHILKDVETKLQVYLENR